MRVRLRMPNGKLHIRRRTTAQWLVWILAFWPFLVRLFNDVLGLPGVFKYIADAIILVMLLLLLARERLFVQQGVLRCIQIVAVFFAYTLISHLFNFQSPFYYLWGFRNLFRFYLAFYLFTAFIDEQDAVSWLKVLDVLFWINFAVSVIQFCVFGTYGDALGGIFGTTGGSNGYTLIFFIIVISKSLLGAFNGTEKASLCFAKCAASFLVAAMAEMKFFYIAFIVLMSMAAFLTRFSGKKFALLLACAVALVCGMSILTLIFDSDGVFSVGNLWTLATNENYSSGNDINRLSAIPSLSRMFLTGPLEKLFGLGLGNCDTAAYAICNTPFYQAYSYLHYTWFTGAMLFLETGYVGLIFYVSFFLACFLYAYRQWKRGCENPVFCQLAIMMVVMCVILMAYNSSLRIESAYMVYFVLAMPFVLGKDTRYRNRKMESI